MLLTTFRSNGSAVPTAVWVTSLDGELAVWTVAGSGKVKRIQANGDVTVAPCDRIGSPLGPATAGTARVLDHAGTARVRQAVVAKYGLTEEQLLETLDRIGSRSKGDVGLAINVLSAAL